MKEPTVNEIKEFWEWCGWKRLEWGRAYFHYEGGEKMMNWMPPDTTQVWQSRRHLPRIDLNNLFKYAWPELRAKIGPVDLLGLATEWIQRILLDGEDPALSFFWLAWEVIHAI